MKATNRLPTPVLPPSTAQLARGNARVLCDAKSGKFIWIKRTLKGEMCLFSLHQCDVNTLERRVISTTVLPPMQVSDLWDFKPLVCLTPDGGEVVCSTYEEVFTVDIRTGKKSLLAKSLPPFDDGSSQYIYARHLSPNCDKVLSVENGAKKPSENQLKTLCIYKNGKLTHRETLPFRSTETWLDDDHVLLTFKDKIISLRFDGTDKRQIYPPLSGGR